MFFGGWDLDATTEMNWLEVGNKGFTTKVGIISKHGGIPSLVLGSHMKLLVPTLQSYLALPICFSVGFRVVWSPHIFPKGMSPTLAS